MWSHVYYVIYFFTFVHWGLHLYTYYAPMAVNVSLPASSVCLSVCPSVCLLARVGPTFSHRPNRLGLVVEVGVVQVHVVELVAEVGVARVDVLRTGRDAAVQHQLGHIC